METKKKLKEKVIDVMTSTFMRSCDVIEVGALRNIVFSRARLDRLVEQSRVLCEDYIYCRLQGLYYHDADNYDAEPDDVKLSDVSLQIQEVGAKLELSYPSLYVDLPRQLSMPLRSQVAVRKALVCIGDSIFRGQPPVITWYRIAALFAVSAAVAREVVVNGNAHLVPVVVTTFTELVDRYLAVWIYRQGGWANVVKQFQPTDKLVRARLAVASAGTLIGFAFFWLYISFLVDMIRHVRS